MGFQCPTCGSEFDTRRGLEVHHSLVHDEQLANRKCADCGDEFYCPYEKKYCSRECRYDTFHPRPRERGHTGAERNVLNAKYVGQRSSITPRTRKDCTVLIASGTNRGGKYLTYEGPSIICGTVGKSKWTVQSATRPSNDIQATSPAMWPCAARNVDERGYHNRSPVPVTRTGREAVTNRTEPAGEAFENRH